MSLPETVSSYGPLQNLYAAARAVVSAADSAEAKALADYLAERDVFPAMVDLLRQLSAATHTIAEASAEAQANRAITRSAVDIYDTDDVNVMGEWAHHNGSDGYWIDAWVWVSAEEAADDDDDDDSSSSSSPSSTSSSSPSSTSSSTNFENYGIPSNTDEDAFRFIDHIVSDAEADAAN